MGHGRALLGLKNKERIPEVAQKVIKQQLKCSSIRNICSRIK